MYKVVFFIMFIFFITFGLFPLGIKEDMNDSQNTTKITGRVVIYGNEPHTFVGIVGEDGTEYAVYPSDQEEKLRALQGHLIEFTVVLLNEPQGYGSLFLKGGTVTPVTWEIIQ